MTTAPPATARATAPAPSAERSPSKPSLPTEDLHAIWGSDVDHVFAVGNKGTILVGGQNGWSPVASVTAENLRSVHGTDADHVWAVGGKAIVAFDGKQWSVVKADMPDELVGVFAASPTDVFVIGKLGTIWKSGGAEWVVQRPAPKKGGGLRSIWGLDAKRVFAVGEGGLFLGYDGKRWAPATGPPSLGWHYANNGSWDSGPSPATFVRIGGLPDGTLFVTNADSFVHTGLPGKWTSLFSGNPTDTRPIISIWAADATHMILLDSEYMNVRRGGPWESCTLGQGTGVRSLCGTDGGHLWGVGTRGLVVRIDPQKLVHGEPCVAAD